MCTSWCLFNLELSTNAFPHSAQTWTLGPWVWRCFLMAELSRNILVQPLWGHAIVLSNPSETVSFFIRIRGLNNEKLEIRTDKDTSITNHKMTNRANSANCFGSLRSKPGILSTAYFLSSTYSSLYSSYSCSGSGLLHSSKRRKNTKLSTRLLEGIVCYHTNKHRQGNKYIFSEKY